LMLIVQKVIYIAFNLHDGKLININLMFTNKRPEFYYDNDDGKRRDVMMITLFNPSVENEAC